MFYNITSSNIMKYFLKRKKLDLWTFKVSQVNARLPYFQMLLLSIIAQSDKKIKF